MRCPSRLGYGPITRKLLQKGFNPPTETGQSMDQTHSLTIFVDESGDLGKLGSKTFTLALLATFQPKRIE